MMTVNDTIVRVDLFNILIHTYNSSIVNNCVQINILILYTYWPDLNHMICEVGSYLGSELEVLQDIRTRYGPTSPPSLHSENLLWVNLSLSLSLSSPPSVRYSDDPTWEPGISVPQIITYCPARISVIKLTPSSLENKDRVGKNLGMIIM